MSGPTFAKKKTQGNSAENYLSPHNVRYMLLNSPFKYKVIDPFYLMSCWHCSTSVAAVTKAIPVTIEWQSTINACSVLLLLIEVTARLVRLRFIPYTSVTIIGSQTTQPYHFSLSLIRWWSCSVGLSNSFSQSHIPYCFHLYQINDISFPQTIF